jgi:hypothetical protein
LRGEDRQEWPGHHHTERRCEERKETANSRSLRARLTRDCLIDRRYLARRSWWSSGITHVR